ncbi:UNVERIFIED_CONTAM: Zinc finger protein GAI-ASSOCIATED FACTOR 1 [Sesamum radiatum]|uniref:Zinc finger protein GAI-ASSOCIATED FACTOR 1 n=1 Tax=Sesamum radiatum TaxID=300843 RepID=A0AAW2W7D8_SESRA
MALSPKTLMATNRYVCEICNKGFQRDQNLQLHRRGHNLPWKLRQRATTDVKKRVYICPEPTCVHHSPARALGDLTGIKKHYSRKHGEKKWKCDKCSKKYAVQSDWKAHQKTCGTREYKCDCGTIFSRRDSFITHRAFCDALAEENSKVNQDIMGPNLQAQLSNSNMGISEFPQELGSFPIRPSCMFVSTLFGSPRILPTSSELQFSSISSPFYQDNNNLGQISGLAQMSATALLQKAAQMGSTASKSCTSSMAGPDQIIGPGYRPISNFRTYGKFQAQNEQPSAFNGEFAAELVPKTSRELAKLFDNGGAGGAAVGDLVMYGGVMLDDDQSSAAGFSENPVGVQEDGDHHGSGLVSASDSTAGNSRRSGGVNDMMTTVDFMGVGGSTAQIVRDQRLELEAAHPERMQVDHNPFHQQFIHHGDSHDVGKPSYNMF